MKKECDVLIIGGGINGCGIAADIATRGLSVILCQKGDLAEGTSSASSKLIHGGLRYLEHCQFRLVRSAIKERERLFKLCPHLIRPCAFMLPYTKDMRPFWLLRLGLFIYDHLSHASVMKTKSLTRKQNRHFFDPLKTEITNGFCYFDATTDDARLVISNALQAQAHHAQILTRTPFLGARRHQDHWISILGNAETEQHVKSKIIINATGPWVESINKTLGISTPYELSLVKGSHLITKKLYSGDHAYILQHEDKRIVFTIPFQEEFTLIGTTEITHHGDLSQLEVGDDEKQYLFELVNHYFNKTITSADIIDSYSGVRPLIKSKHKTNSKHSRDYKINFDKRKAGLITIFGGKLTTYRKLATECSNLLRPIFPMMKPSLTAELPLPGRDIPCLATFNRACTETYSWLPHEILQRYVKNYGTRMHIFLKNCHSLACLGHHYGAGLYQKELSYLIQHEWAKTTEDILWRRTKLRLILNEKEINQLEKELSNVF